MQDDRLGACAILFTMNFTLGAFVTSLVTGSVGYVYWSFGRKMSKPLYLVSGVLLMIFPYFVDSIPLSIVIGAALAALPFFVRM